MLSGVGLVAALGIVIAAVAAVPDSAESTTEDPLQMLAIAQQAEAEAVGPADDPEIDPKLNLTFYEAQERKVKAVLSNTFGFGGHNACLSVKKYQNNS